MTTRIRSDSKGRKVILCQIEIQLSFCENVFVYVLAGMYRAGPQPEVIA